MQTSDLKPLMTRHGMAAAAAVGIVIGAVTLVLALGVTGGHAGAQTGGEVAAGPSAVSVAVESETIQVQRVQQVREYRAENLAEFDAMEQAPGLYTQSESSASTLRDRVATIDELREQNLADFAAMKRYPGLHT